MYNTTAMKKIINLAVIAHVDAGKSTLVDAILKEAQVFGDREQDVNRVMDSDDLEKERGITIYSKNCSVTYNDYKLNVVDTPGHADFSSEVERIIQTVDTVILLVDSSEGPMPQTRFVLRKALEHNLNPILVINKIDKKDQRIDEVIEEVFELFVDLDANDRQLEFPILYGIAKEGIIRYNPEDTNTDIQPLFETIVKHTDAYPNKDDQHLQLQISSLAYDAYVGRLGIGRLFQGTLSKGEWVSVHDNHGNLYKHQVRNIYTYQGLTRVETDVARSGDIVQISGIAHISIGDTLNNPDHIDPLPVIEIEEPTLSMNFMVNTSPFAGKDGKYITSRNLNERLHRELEVNVGLKVEETESPDIFKVSGRGELHLTILIENMRREGYELAISKPRVITKLVDGKQYEPIEEVMVELTEEYSGTIISQLNIRQGEMVDMKEFGSMLRQYWHVPTRGLIGFRSDFINMTHGEGTMVRKLYGYEPLKGEVPQRQNGSMVSIDNGTAMTYSIFHLQERGQFFIGPQTEVYEGMIVGISSRKFDMEVNPTKNKKGTAIRSAGKDEAMRLVPALPVTLESAIEFIRDDELVEVTPKAIRLRKQSLKSHERKNSARRSD